MNIQPASPLRNRWLGRRDGNAMIETSLSLMIFMTIFLAIMEFGWGMFNYNFVSYAAREGARFGTTRGSLCASPCVQATNDTIQAFIRNQAGAMDASQVAVTTTWLKADGTSGDNTPGNTVKVAVSYPIPPLLGWLMGPITITASSTMTIAQ